MPYFFGVALFSQSFIPPLVSGKDYFAFALERQDFLRAKGPSHANPGQRPGWVVETGILYALFEFPEKERATYTLDFGYWLSCVILDSSPIDGSILSHEIMIAPRWPRATLLGDAT
jgi:hypothetical protein